MTRRPRQVRVSFECEWDDQSASPKYAGFVILDDAQGRETSVGLPAGATVEPVTDDVVTGGGQITPCGATMRHDSHAACHGGWETGTRSLLLRLDLWSKRLRDGWVLEGDEGVEVSALLAEAAAARTVDPRSISGSVR